MAQQESEKKDYFILKFGLAFFAVILFSIALSAWVQSEQPFS